MRILFVRASNTIDVTYWKLVVELLDNNCEIWWISKPLLRDKLIIDKNYLQKIHLIEISSLSKIDFMIKAIPHIHSLSKSIDIIIGTGYSGTLPCILAFPHCPTISHFHDPLYIENTLNKSLILKLLIGFGRILEFLLIKKTSHIILTSISHKKFLQKRQKFVSEKQITIIRNTINPDKIPMMKEDNLKTKMGLQNKFLIVYSGQIIKSYGFDDLIKAFAKINKKYPQTHLLLIGIYPNLSYKIHLKKLIFSHKLDSDITFLPTIPSKEVPYYLFMSDFAIIPWSYAPVINLATPNKLFEYMACYLPIVASELDGICEIIENGKNGFLFKPNNLDSLIKTLEKAIIFPELSSIGDRNRQSIEGKYNLKKYVKLLLKLCQYLLKTRKKKDRY